MELKSTLFFKFLRNHFRVAGLRLRSPCDNTGKNASVKAGQQAQNERAFPVSTGHCFPASGRGHIHAEVCVQRPHLLLGNQLYRYQHHLPTGWHGRVFSNDSPSHRSSSFLSEQHDIQDSAWGHGVDFAQRTLLRCSS